MTHLFYINQAKINQIVTIRSYDGMKRSYDKRVLTSGNTFSQLRITCSYDYSYLLPLHFAEPYSLISYEEVGV